MSEQKQTVTELLTENMRHPEYVRELPLGAIPGMLAQLAAAQSILAAQLVESVGRPNTPDGAAGDRLLTVEEAAEKLGVAPDWLYRRAARLPFTVRLGRSVRFSEAGIARFIRQRSGK